MTPEEARRLWEAAVANSKAWRECVGPHDLEDITPEKKLGKRYRCRLCGGTCDGVAKHHYEQGLRHGRAAAEKEQR